MKRYIKSSQSVQGGKLVDGLLKFLNNTFSDMLKDSDIKAKPEAVKVKGNNGVKYLVSLAEREGEEFLTHGVENEETGVVSGDVEVTFIEVPKQEDKVIVLIEPDSSQWSLKEVTSKPLDKGKANEFFQKWMDKYDLEFETDAEGNAEVIDEDDLDNENAEEEFKAASTQIFSSTSRYEQLMEGLSPELNQMMAEQMIKTHDMFGDKDISPAEAVSAWECYMDITVLHEGGQVFTEWHDTLGRQGQRCAGKQFHDRYYK